MYPYTFVFALSSLFLPCFWYFLQHSSMSCNSLKFFDSFFQSHHDVFSLSVSQHWSKNTLHQQFQLIPVFFCSTIKSPFPVAFMVSLFPSCPTLIISCCINVCHYHGVYWCTSGSDWVTKPTFKPTLLDRTTNEWSWISSKFLLIPHLSCAPQVSSSTSKLSSSLSLILLLPAQPAYGTWILVLLKWFYTLVCLLPLGFNWKSKMSLILLSWYCLGVICNLLQELHGKFVHAIVVLVFVNSTFHLHDVILPDFSFLDCHTNEDTRLFLLWTFLCNVAAQNLHSQL